MKSIFCFAVLSLSLCACSSDKVWTYADETNMPDNWNALDMTVSKDIKTPDGEKVLELNPAYGRADLEYPSFLIYPIQSSFFKDAKSVTISFWAKGEKGTELALRVTENAPKSGHYTPTKAFPMNGDWQKIVYSERFYSVPGGKWTNAPRLLIEKNKAGQCYYIGPMTVKAVTGKE